MSAASCFASRSTSPSGTTYRALGSGGRTTTVVVVVVGVAVVGVVGVRATGIVVGASLSGATSVSGSVPAVEDCEHPETTRTMAARPAKLIAEAPSSRRTGSPCVPGQPTQHWLAYRHSMHESGRNSFQLGIGPHWPSPSDIGQHQPARQSGRSATDRHHPSRNVMVSSGPPIASAVTAVARASRWQYGLGCRVSDSRAISSWRKGGGGAPSSTCVHGSGHSGSRNFWISMR